MNPDKPTETDHDLRERFAELREAEATSLPGFRETLAVARTRRTGEGRSSRGTGFLVPAGAAAAVTILAFASLRKPEETPSGSLAALPVLFATDQSDQSESRWLSGPPLAGTALPSDGLLPFHLRIRL